MKSKNPITTIVADIYQWLDNQIRQHDTPGHKCGVCGKCCDFEGFDHKLFVTTPEMIYLTSKLAEPLKPMPDGKCPYSSTGGKCKIYQYLFAGCRIFNCKSDADFQSRLSEEAIKKLSVMDVKTKAQPYK